MNSKFIVFCVIAALLVSPFALADTADGRNFLAKMVDFFAGNDVEDTKAQESGPDSVRERSDGRPEPSGGGSAENHDSGDEGATGESGSAQDNMGVPVGRVCNPCATVVCEVEDRPIDSDMAQVGDVFICPGRLSDCQRSYGNCWIPSCSKPVGCTEKVHTCYEEGRPIPRGQMGGSTEEIPVSVTIDSDDGYWTKERMRDTKPMPLGSDSEEFTDEGCIVGGTLYEFGERFKQDCNVCSCDKNGNIKCTLRECAPNPVCGNGICEAGEASFCPSQNCKEGEPCIAAPCYVGSCEKDCKEPEPEEPIRCVGTLEECREQWGYCSCGWSGGYDGSTGSVVR